MPVFFSPVVQNKSRLSSRDLFWLWGGFLPLVAFADIRRDAVAALADGYAQTECHVHCALLDGNPLGRVLGRYDVGCEEEVDPARAEVHRQADGSAAVVEHRVASRNRESSVWGGS